MHIILTQQQRDAVTSDTLQPRALASGLYAVGVEVMDDPEHADVREILKTCPTRDVQNAEWAEESLDG